MGRFASETTVSVEKSRAEIEFTLRKYKATEFVSGWSQGKAMIGFRINELFIQFVLPLPDRKDKQFTHKMKRGWLQPMTDAQSSAVYEQEVRQRWRALNLVVKAKLEAVECGISTIEKEFLAFIVLPGNITLGDWIIEGGGMQQLKEGKMPRMLAPPRSEPDDDVEDAESTVVPFDPKQANG